MENCLVTKLKGVVENGSLIKIGHMVFNVKERSTSSASIRFTSVNSMQITALDGGYFSTTEEGEHLTSMTISAYTDTFLYFANANFRVDISNKYDLLVFECNATNAFEVNLSDMAYCNRLQVLGLTYCNVNGDIEDIKNLSSLVQLKAAYSNIKGDIANLVGLTNLTLINLIGNSSIFGDINSLASINSLQTVYLEDTKVSGELSSILNITGLTEINVAGTDINVNIAAISGMSSIQVLSLGNTATSGSLSSIVNVPTLRSLGLNITNVTGSISDISTLTELTELKVGSTSVNGTIESYAQGLINNGKTSGSVRVQMNESGVTYQGNSYTFCTITINGSSYTVVTA